MQFTASLIATMALFTSLSLAAPASSSTTSKTIRIQLNGISGEDATQHEVPVDNSAFSLNVASDIFSAQVIDLEGFKFASCQVFSDLNGRIFSSEVSFTTEETELLLGSVGTVPVGSVRCQAQ
ncbi:hypothetical protein BGZ60DRAFT_432850 [Tricladium varicosporioides]|nr:hypothetical protein BGZ60DRAFT_432850 [Hymenoscyphus varicosporioides]